ncbi:hypothetical protein AVEN_206750-1 [Araneus ventricosus]|uniref:Uncharacterized protein n=1 Tax=Araneus ventricosus TaxID=182803 RepID=A0A4Y2C6B0_ARAVE|nr:hypothetical protein AVEN_206750-1 [Araneus ventricosus]
MVRESTSRQKMLLNVRNHQLKKQHSHLSSDFVAKRSSHAPYCTRAYPSTALGTMEIRHSSVDNKGNQSIGQYLSVHKDSFSNQPTTDAPRKRLPVIVLR